MGNCTIVVHLTGPHHNRKNPGDANRIAARFVDQLKEAGHTVEHASFTSGGREDLLDPSSFTRAAPHDGD